MLVRREQSRRRRRRRRLASTLVGPPPALAGAHIMPRHPIKLMSHAGFTGAVGPGEQVPPQLPGYPVRMYATFISRALISRQASLCLYGERNPRSLSGSAKSKCRSSVNRVKSRK